jgi:hypothetical protein
LLLDAFWSRTLTIVVSGHGQRSATPRRREGGQRTCLMSGWRSGGRRRVVQGTVGLHGRRWPVVRLGTGGGWRHPGEG